MKKLLQCSLSLWLVIFSVKAHALVDYSETNATPSSAIKTMTKTTSSSEAKGLIWKSDISMAANYESAEYQSKQIGLINLNTPFIVKELRLAAGQTCVYRNHINIGASLNLQWLSSSVTLP